VIRQKNARTIEWLGPIPHETRGRLGDYCPPLASRLQAWRLAPIGLNALYSNSSVALSNADSLSMDGRDVSVRFVEIGSTARPTTVIFLEDLARTKQAAQQIKLASLGRLTASIAHEIRNPLSSIAHATELLQEDENRNPADARMLKIVHDNAQRIDRLIEEVLYLNRRDRAKPEFINASIYLEEFVDNFCQVEAVSKDLIGIECELTETLRFDRTHLDQIVWNLLRNAVRYCSKKPGSILLYCRTMSQTVQMGVIDDGSGVSTKDLHHLFEPFFTTDAQGTGIGLYMARELSEANGAQLEYVPTALTSGAHFRLSRLI
jgi:two-component system, NtrC family, sensor histidine kinase PilS